MRCGGRKSEATKVGATSGECAGGESAGGNRRNLSLSLFSFAPLLLFGIFLQFSTARSRSFDEGDRKKSERVSRQAWERRL
jgi:hypothetical protein